MSMTGSMQGGYYGEGPVNNYYYQGSGAMVHQPVRDFALGLTPDNKRLQEIYLT